MRIFLISLLLFLVCTPPSWAKDKNGYKVTENNRVLVALDNYALRDTHSTFFADLQAKGYIVDFKVVNAESFKLQEYGEYLYDHLIIFSTSDSESKYLKNDKILEFFDSGHNVIIAGDVDSSKNYRTLVAQFGVDFDVFGSKVYDHVNKADNADHSLFYTGNIVHDPFTSLAPGRSILYRGIGMSLTPYENFQVWGILRGEPYTYSRSDVNGAIKTISTGNQVVLAAAIQGRNNARAIITGSLDMFSDELFSKSQDANRIFSRDLAEWTFQLRGVLRVDRIFHHHASDSSHQPGEYKVYDDLVYNLDISTYDSHRGEWVPYAGATDLQVDFVMLDPYVRTALVDKSKNGNYSVAFRAPDKYGVFQFKVNYRRPGWSFLTLANKITVRPFKHNEYERYLFEAYPYYAVVLATLGGFFIFIVFFLYTGNARHVHKKQE